MAFRNWVLKTSKLDYITLLLKTLQWLPTSHRTRPAGPHCNIGLAFSPSLPVPPTPSVFCCVSVLVSLSLNVSHLFPIMAFTFVSSLLGSSFPRIFVVLPSCRMALSSDATSSDGRCVVACCQLVLSPLWAVTVLTAPYHHLACCSCISLCSPAHPPVCLITTVSLAPGTP